MRTMNDDLMVRIAINQALLSSMVIGMLLKFRIQVNCIFMLKVTEHSYFYPKVPSINACSLDAVGSWQIILPMPKSERAY